MPATPLLDIVTNMVRPALIELTARFWTDAELLDIMRGGVLDLWGGILDAHGDHYITVDQTNVSLAANSSVLAGVPTDCFRVQLIEPRDITFSGGGRSLIFAPRKYKESAFTGARTMSAQDPASGGVIYFQLTGLGAPNSAPVILVAPQLTAALPLRLVYNQTLTVGTANPIPGESDTALKAWTMAFARAKEREDRLPDPGWMGTYASERAHILTRLTPRQEQEPDVVEDFF